MHGSKRNIGKYAYIKYAFVSVVFLSTSQCVDQMLIQKYSSTRCSIQKDWVIMFAESLESTQTGVLQEFSYWSDSVNVL